MFAIQNTRLTDQRTFSADSHPFCDGFFSLVWQAEKKWCFLKGKFKNNNKQTKKHTKKPETKQQKTQLKPSMVISGSCFAKLSKFKGI